MPSLLSAPACSLTMSTAPSAEKYKFNVGEIVTTLNMYIAYLRNTRVVLKHSTFLHYPLMWSVGMYKEC